MNRLISDENPALTDALNRMAEQGLVFGISTNGLGSNTLGFAANSVSLDSQRLEAILLNQKVIATALARLLDAHNARPGGTESEPLTADGAEPPAKTAE